MGNISGDPTLGPAKLKPRAPPASPHLAVPPCLSLLRRRFGAPLGQRIHPPAVLWERKTGAAPTPPNRGPILFTDFGAGRSPGATLSRNWVRNSFGALDDNGQSYCKVSAAVSIRASIKTSRGGPYRTTKRLPPPPHCLTKTLDLLVRRTPPLFDCPARDAGGQTSAPPCHVQPTQCGGCHGQIKSRLMHRVCANRLAAARMRSRFENNASPSGRGPFATDTAADTDPSSADAR